MEHSLTTLFLCYYVKFYKYHVMDQLIFKQCHKASLQSQVDMAVNS